MFSCLLPRHVLPVLIELDIIMNESVTRRLFISKTLKHLLDKWISAFQQVYKTLQIFLQSEPGSD